MDVCQRIPSFAVLQSTDNPGNAVDLSEFLSELYSYTPLLPGFSIGPKDKHSCAGSFSGFIKHTTEISGRHEIFGLTCEHVLNGLEPKVLGSSEEYKYEGEKKFTVTMPAMGDHEATVEGISKRRERVAERALELKDEKKNQLRCPDSSTKRFSGEYEILVLFEKHYQEAEQQAKAYNIEVGHVYATSGRDKSRQFYDGCLDWGIFCCPFPNAKPKVS